MVDGLERMLETDLWLLRWCKVDGFVRCSVGGAGAAPLCGGAAVTGSRGGRGAGTDCSTVAGPLSRRWCGRAGPVAAFRSQGSASTGRVGRSDRGLGVATAAAPGSGGSPGDRRDRGAAGLETAVVHVGVGDYRRSGSRAAGVGPPRRVRVPGFL